MKLPGHTRVLLAIVVLVLSGGFVFWKAARLLNDPTFFPPDDFVEYYAAGRLNLQGKNPYDGNELLPLEQQAGRATDEAIMMWNPPWTLTFVMPIGAFPEAHARLAQLLWLAASLALVVACGDMLWMHYGGSPARRWLAALLSLTFMPTLFVLQAGQIGPFILAGITGFLVCERRGWLFAAGTCGVLMAVKPHLVYLFWLALAGWVTSQPLPGRWRVIGGGVVVGALATAIPLAFNPEVIGQYWEALRQRTPDQWKSPTFGSYLRADQGNFGLQFLPTIAGIGWLSISSWTTRSQTWKWSDRLPMIVLVSFVTASYGAWPFDLVILLPAVIHVAVGLTIGKEQHKIVLGVVAYAGINMAALTMNLTGITTDRFIWVAPALLACYAYLRPRTAAA